MQWMMSCRRSWAALLLLPLLRHLGSVLILQPWWRQRWVLGACVLALPTAQTAVGGSPAGGAASWCCSGKLPMGAPGC